MLCIGRKKAQKGKVNLLILVKYASDSSTTTLSLGFKYKTKLPEMNLLRVTLPNP